jgi:hypothetical protein
MSLQELGVYKMAQRDILQNWDLMVKLMQDKWTAEKRVWPGLQ